MTELEKKREHKLQQRDIRWALALFGTAIGAGVLFLPIRAGIDGFIPVIAMFILAWPLVYYAHRNMTRFVLSGNAEAKSIVDVVRGHWGHRAGDLFSLLYFLSIFPILILYAVALTNNIETSLHEFYGAEHFMRPLIAAIVVLAVMAVAANGKSLIVRVMGWLVYPFIAALLLFSLGLIPHWSLSHISLAAPAAAGMAGGGSALAGGGGGAGAALGSALYSSLMIIPVMVFAFNHSPAISAFAISYKKSGDKAAELAGTDRALKLAHGLMLSVVLFFVLSCVLTLTPAQMGEAQTQNVSTLDYLAIYLQQPAFKYSAALIAFIAIIKSFLGHYLGAREGFSDIVRRLSGGRVSLRAADIISLIFMGICAYLAAVFNPSVLSIIEKIAAPVVCLILFIMPVYASWKVPAVRALFSERDRFGRWFPLIIGLITIILAIAGWLGFGF